MQQVDTSPHERYRKKEKKSPKICPWKRGRGASIRSGWKVQRKESVWISCQECV